MPLVPPLGRTAPAYRREEVPNLYGTISPANNPSLVKDIMGSIGESAAHQILAKPVRGRSSIFDTARANRLRDASVSGPRDHSRDDLNNSRRYHDQSESTMYEECRSRALIQRFQERRMKPL